jgi:hypothetical protein
MDVNMRTMDVGHVNMRTMDVNDGREHEYTMDVNMSTRWT